MREPHIVRFKNGEYAVRKKTLFGGWKYRSLFNPWWWAHYSEVNSFCAGTKAEAQLALDRLNGAPYPPEDERDYGVPI